MLLFEYFWRFGFVSRYKVQPFFYAELGGPSKEIPDFLVELTDGQVHVVEVKSGKFVTAEILGNFKIHRSFMKEFGISHHLWTDTDPRNLTNKLNRQTWHSVRHVDRGLCFELDSLARARLQELVDSGATYLGELMKPDLFGWDQLMAAITLRIFDLNITEKIHENTPIFRSLPSDFYAHFFEEKHVAEGWWNSLPSRRVE